MLRRFKDQLSQVADELPVVLNTRLNGNSRDSERNNFDDLNGEIEGFLCPRCMTHFPSPEMLQQHFDTMHQEENAFVNPNYEGAQGVTRQERSEKEISLEELRIQLREEKVYAMKLKEELDRIQSVVAQATDVPEGEVPYLLQQIQVLEAGKSMVTQRMLEFEKEANQLKRAVDNGEKERAEIMAKLKQQSQQLRELTDEAESNKVEKEVLNRQLLKTNADAEKLNKEIDKLNKTLDQRPSEDDVAVLRTELVNAQKLMDEIAQQKDVEIQEHIHAIRQLNLEREKDNCIKQNLQKELQSTGATSSEKATRLFDLEKELEETKALLQASQKDVTQIKNQAAQLETKTNDLQTRLNSKTQELTVCREKIAELETTVRKGSHDIEDASSLNVQNQEKLFILSQKLEQMVEEKKKQELEALALEEAQQQQEEKIKSLEHSNNELTKELSSQRVLLEQERVILEHKKQENEDLTRKSKDFEAKIEEVNSKCERQTKDLEDGAGVISSLREKISKLEGNAQELMNKITEGEGGAKMALDQLTSENKKLSDTCVELNAQLQEQKALRETEIDNLNVKLREADRSSAELMNKARKEQEELKKKLREADEELKKNSDRFEEMERDTEIERKKFSERFEKLKEIVQQKDTTIANLKEQSEQLLTENSEKEKLLKDKERHLEESRIKIEESVKRLEEAEAKARELENSLKSSELLRETASSTEEELREELTKAHQSIESLKSEGSKLTARVNEKDSEIEAIKRDWEQKSQHWDAKKKEYERQLVKNQETNDELLNSLKETQDTVTTLKKEAETRQKDLITSKSLNDEMSGRITEMENVIEVQKKKETEITKKLEETVSDKQIVEKMKQELEEELVILNEKVDQNEKVVQQLTEEKIQLEEQRHNLQVSSESVQQAVEKSEREVEQHRQELNNLREENAQLNEKVTTNEVELANQLELMKRLEEDFTAEKVNHKGIVDGLVRENAELSEEHRKLGEKIETIEAQLSESISNKEKLERELNESRALTDEKSKEVMTLTGAMNMLTEKTESQEHIFATKQNELQEALSQLKRTIQSLQSELDHRNQELSEAKTTASELAAKNMELQQEVTSWNDEKNVLIERCLRTESDLEFERDRALENKRRFDDSVAAMHELGRANQSLQMDISKHASRKWLDDSAAVNCTACGKMFTMTIRKHHCRVCGLIFCAQCSDKTAKVVSNKNPVRVCGSCYVEVMNR